MLSLLLTRMDLHFDLLLSVCTYMRFWESLFICHLSLSGPRRKGEALSQVSLVTETKENGHTSSNCQRKCQGYVPIILITILHLWFLRIHKNSPQKAVITQKTSWYVLGFATDIAVHFYMQTYSHKKTHTQSCSSVINHIHFYPLVSDATAPLFLAGFYVRVTGLDCWKWTWNTCRL